MYTKLERERYNDYRDNVCKALNITKNQYNWLRRKGNELHKIYEDQCNGTDNRPAGIENRLYLAVDKYAKDLGVKVYYQTDPRGATIYIDRKNIPENNYTQAYCIY